MLLSFEKTKQSILPSKSVNLIGNMYQKLFSGTYGTIFKIAIPYIINWYINRKRGD
jgi:nitrate/nitrite transporter NarK